MRTFNKTKLALGVAAGMAMLAASTGAQAISTGTDFNLSAKARAGGMGGAAYTMPQEASAAVFGNPATMTQFKGINMNFGASLLTIDLTSEDKLTGNKHTSDADNYIIPDFGLTLQVSPNLVIGTGLEVDAGLGADYRDDPILEGIVVPGGLNLEVELISFNANLAAAYKVTDQWSVGSAITIGFGMLQVGDNGGELGEALGGVTSGSNSSVHDVGFGLSLGTTYEIQDGIMTSLAVKSPVKYSFKNVSNGKDLGAPGSSILGNDSSLGGTDFQDTELAQPLEVILGVAFDNVMAPGLLVEADVIWKNWSDAEFYQDLWDDQILIALGAQYETGDWTYRAGYSWADDIILSNPKGNNVGDLTHASPGVPFTPDAKKIVQMSLAPVIWQHTVTTGIGYNFTESVSVDAYVAYAFGETDEQSFEGVLGDLGLEGQKADAKSEVLIGAGINIALP